MKSIALAVSLISLLSGSLLAQGPVKKTALYLKQDAPGLVPKVFAPGLVSLQNRYEFGSVFSKDGKEFYYAVDTAGKAEIRFMRLKNNEWTMPVKLVVSDKYGYNDPCLSIDEKRLFFISDMPLDGVGSSKDYDIWYIERSGDEWSKPINAGKEINSNKNEYYISFSKNGTMYFSSNVNSIGENKNDYDIYSSKQIKGKFQPRVKLSDAINTPGYEADVLIASDESYIIFCASRQDGLGNGDLYISFKKPDGSWTKSKNMGNLINTKEHELCPFVTRDGKYFFYTGDKEIRWVDAGIIKQLR
jgi:hypothetical protein